MAADDATAIQRKQIDRVLVVIGVDLAAIGPAQRLPLSLFDENFVPQTEMLLEDVVLEMAIERRNCMNHEFPHSRE